MGTTNKEGQELFRKGRLKRIVEAPKQTDRTWPLQVIIRET